MAQTRITDHKKEEIRDAADIVDVVSDYVKLKKAGGAFTGLCPFHNERTPSFYVTPRLGIFKCFGCGEGGDVFNFVMKMEGVGFVEAMRSLAGRYNIELPEEESSESADAQTQLVEGIYHALRFAGVYYHQTLAAEDSAAAARDYIGRRGLTAATTRKWGVGYAPDAFDAFYKHALSSGINETYLHEAGLIKYSEQNQQVYDTFRGRLMFPIFSPSGKVIGFGGRIMEGGKGPKYINSPQTKVYNKSEVIYGIHMARNEIRKHDQSILVEGYMDVISLWQHGVTNVVATSGTSITPEQMRRLANYSPNLLMVYDADNAGQNAMLRGLDVALQAGLHVRLMHLPDGEDPDSFVQQFGAESFINYTRKEAKDFISFMVQHAEDKGEWDDPMSRKQVVSRILASIARVSDQVLRETLIGHLRKMTGIGERALYAELGSLAAAVRQEEARAIDRERRAQQREMQGGAPHPAEGQFQNPGSGGASAPAGAGVPRTRPVQVRRPAAEKEIIRLMIEHGDGMIYYVGNLIGPDYFTDPELRQFYEAITACYEQEIPATIEHFTAMEPPFPRLVSEVFIEQFAVSEVGNAKRSRSILRDADPFATARGAVKSLALQFLSQQIEEVNQQLSYAGEDERSELYRSITELRKTRLQIEKSHADALYPAPDEMP
ncbi:MAG: DNA primase [Candidatus Cyclonatronum sp.]|uniref:DNA primase n=1 Tax=Cyclonatronum sp. TaxID=3024185 RepID=UPI0025C1945D|nr:DNA primase [Cyclonatronum sp.]MCH8486475.1 DNA primase [Cyclonatronum sp.]